MASAIWVECNGKKGIFSLEDFKRNSRSQCITCEGKQFSPSAFEAYSGKGLAKKWRLSLKYNGRPIDDYLTSLGVVSGNRQLNGTNEETNTSRLDMNGQVESDHVASTAGSYSRQKRSPSPSRMASAPRRRRVRNESTGPPRASSSVASDEEQDDPTPQGPARGLRVEVWNGFPLRPD